MKLALHVIAIWIVASIAAAVAAPGASAGELDLGSSAAQVLGVVANTVGIG